jgi:flagellar protein FliO/FliZ
MSKFLLAILFLLSLANTSFAQNVDSEAIFNQKIKEMAPEVVDNDSITLTNEKAAATDKSNSTTDTKEQVVKSESEIPVNLGPAKKASNEVSPWMRLLLGVSVLGIMAAAVAILYRKGFLKKSTHAKGMQIQVLTQHYLGPKKSLAIIRVAGESILLGVTDNNINMIKSLSFIDDEIPTETPKSFKASLGEIEFEQSREEEAFLRSSLDTKQNSGRLTDSNNEEEFSISGIRDVVRNRLRGLRG